METYAASLHKHHKDAIGKPKHISRIRCRLLGALPKQLPLPSWAPGKKHAAELSSANKDRIGLKLGSRVRAPYGGWEATLQLPPSSPCTQLSCKCSHLPQPAKASWNTFQELENTGFMSIRLSPGQEGEVSTELAPPSAGRDARKHQNRIQLLSRQLN